MAAGSRRLDWSAITAFAPLVALAPPWLVAIAVFWVPFGVWGDVTFQLFAAAHLALGIVLFSRPVQRLVFARMLGARNPTRAELDLLQPAWAEVAEANRMQPSRFVLAVVEGDDVNAFAAGGERVDASIAIEIHVGVAVHPVHRPVQHGRRPAVDRRPCGHRVGRQWHARLAGKHLEDLDSARFALGQRGEHHRIGPPSQFSQ